jgi:hypothetical protein
MKRKSCRSAIIQRVDRLPQEMLFARRSRASEEQGESCKDLPASTSSLPGLAHVAPLSGVDANRSSHL